jgi:hypothetical protein
MKYFLKSSLTGLFVLAAISTVSAQKIDDQDLKVNVDGITNSTEKLMKLNPVTFNYDLEKYPELKLSAGKQYGFLADNVQAEFPGMVYETVKNYPAGKNTDKIVRYNDVSHADLVPILVQAIKDQQQEIDLLKKEISSLKQK